MKYSLPFFVTNPYLDKVDELMINYTKENGGGLIDFLASRPEKQRVVLKIENDSNLEENDFKFLSTVKNSYPNFNFVLRLEPSKRSYIDFSKKYNLPFFLNLYCSTIDEVQELINFGVSDIYIIGPLGFNVKKVKEICGGQVYVRAFPNIAQTATPFGNTVTGFYILPQNILLYNDYIDYIEFYTDDIREGAKLYNIYTSKIIYNKDISTLITNFPEGKANVNCMPLEFGQERLNCHKVCINGHCNLCEKFLGLAAVLKSKNCSIKEDKNEK